LVEVAIPTVHFLLIPGDIIEIIVVQTTVDSDFLMTRGLSSQGEQSQHMEMPWLSKSQWLAQLAELARLAYYSCH
jgi:hypothetical protein